VVIVESAQLVIAHLQNHLSARQNQLIGCKKIGRQISHLAVKKMDFKILKK
jgi:hypothetical protein